MVTPLIRGSQLQRPFPARPSYMTRLVSARTVRLKGDKEQDWLLAGRSRRHRPPGPTAVLWESSVEGSASAQTLLSIIHPLRPGHLSALRTFPSPQNVPARRCCCYTELSFPGSDLEQGANPHLSQREHLAPPEAESESEEDVGWVTWASVEGTGPGHNEKTFQRLGFGRSNE